MRKTLLWIVGLVIFLAPVTARAQFLGYTSPQSNQLKVLDAASGLQRVTVRNIGQTAHYLYYLTDVPGGSELVQFSIELDASYDGTNWFLISQPSVDTVSGAIFAVGYYPYVSVNLTKWTAVGAGVTVSAWYSGTSTVPSFTRGLFNQSGVTSSRLAVGLDATTGWLLGPLEPVNSSAGGYLDLQFSAAGACTGGDPYLEVFSAGPDGTTTDNLIALMPVRCGIPGTGPNQMLRVPALPGQSVLVGYIVPAAVTVPAGDTFDLTFFLNPPQSASVLFPNLTTVSATRGLLQRDGLSLHTVQLTVAGSPANCTFELDGSLDSTDGTDGNWFDLSGPVDCSVAANNLFHVANKLVPWVRGNVTALSSGTVTMYYIGKH
jgi:hypothetical protein